MHQGQGQPSGRLPCLRGMGSVPRGRLSLSSSFLHRPGACMLNRRQADLSLGCQSSVRQAVPQLLLPAGQVASMTNRGIQLLLCVERKTAGCPSAPSSCKAHKQGRGKKPFRARCAGCCHGSGSIHGLARLQPPAILLPRCISTGPAAYLLVSFCRITVARLASSSSSRQRFMLACALAKMAEILWTAAACGSDKCSRSIDCRKETTGRQQVSTGHNVELLPAGEASATAAAGGPARAAVFGAAASRMVCATRLM